MKTLCAYTYVGEKNFKKLGVKPKSKIEYYELQSDFYKYGIEIVKRMYKENMEIVEAKSIVNLVTEDMQVHKLISILKENAVTPIIAEYVLEDLMKQYHIQ